MKTNGFTLTIHMVSSLDGFIANKENSIDWLNTDDYFEKGLPEQDHESFLKTIDCYVMGAGTYQHALALSANYGWPYGDTPTIVVTSREWESHRSNIEMYAGDLQDLVYNRLRPAYKNVWLVGGSMLTKAFIKLKLADELRVSILPILLGDGLLFFDFVGQEQRLHLKDVHAFKTGRVELCYDFRKD